MFPIYLTGQKYSVLEYSFLICRPKSSEIRENDCRMVPSSPEACTIQYSQPLIMGESVVPPCMHSTYLTDVIEHKRSFNADGQKGGVPWSEKAEPHIMSDRKTIGRPLFPRILSFVGCNAQDQLSTSADGECIDLQCPRKIYQKT